MRNLIASLVGLSLLGMLLFAGAAGSRSDQFNQVDLNPTAVRRWMADVAAISSPPSSESDAQAPSDEPSRPWCDPPFAGTFCGESALGANRLSLAAEQATYAESSGLPRWLYLLIPDHPPSVEGWRPLVSYFFKPGDVDRALRVIRCESNGDPLARNRHSSARGLFQQLGRYWPRRVRAAGLLPKADLYDPVANTAVAAWLVYHDGGWSHWATSRSCWR